MLRRACVLALLTMLALPAGVLADTGKTVTATGAARAPVAPTDRKSDASIRAAVEAAHRQAVPLAVAAARAQAEVYASAGGLTLGGVQSITDATLLSGLLGLAGTGGTDSAPFPVSVGPAGVENYCGVVSQPPVFRRPTHGHKPVRMPPRKVCFVPPFAYASLSVTYFAT